MYSVKTIVPALLSWIVGHFINQAGKQNMSEAEVGFGLVRMEQRTRKILMGWAIFRLEQIICKT